MLHPLTGRAEMREAFDELSSRLAKGARRLTRYVGWQGGGEDVEIWWRESEGYWCVLDPRPSTPRNNRFRCWFGVDPGDDKSLSIVCEANPPFQDVDRRCAGVFVRDAASHVYLAHSGKVGGGKKGVGKQAFLDSYRGVLHEVCWPDGQVSELVVLGRVDGTRLPQQVGHFVREVERFKAEVGEGRASGRGSSYGYRPEFAGVRAAYSPPASVETTCDHGLVVDQLHRELAARGYRTANDRARDLFTTPRRGQQQILFEVKTEASTSSIYAAVGQLMVHGAAARNPPVRVAVLPGQIDRKTRTVLRRLQIRVVSYSWKNNRPTFRALDDALG